jgi:acyl-coenzyme A thioesterase PaaI-like protein
VTVEETRTSEGPGAILLELDFASDYVDDGVQGRVRVTPELHGPGTGRLRTSVVAALVDILLGNVAARHITPRNAMTTHLEVHLFHPLPSAGTLEITGRPLRFGRSLLVLEAEISHEGSALGLGTVSFVPAPDPTMISETEPPNGTTGPLLSVPLAERAGIGVLSPGHALLPDRFGVRNGGGIYSGGLLGVVAEEAALSLAPGEGLATLAITYLQAVRAGPAVARAELHHGIGRVEVRDSGRDDRLAALAITRTFAVQ